MNIAEAEELFGLSGAYTEADIDAAYKTLAKEFHPDMHGNTPAANIFMRQINEAKAALKDKRRRPSEEPARPRSEGRERGSEGQKRSEEAERERRERERETSDRCARERAEHRQHEVARRKEKAKQSNSAHSSRVGERLKLGSWDGRELWWKVFKEDRDRVLAVCEGGVDLPRVPDNRSADDPRYRTIANAWMKHCFLPKAFSAEERGRIIEATCVSQIDSNRNEDGTVADTRFGAYRIACRPALWLTV